MALHQDVHSLVNVITGFLKRSILHLFILAACFVLE